MTMVLFSFNTLSLFSLLPNSVHTYFILMRHYAWVELSSSSLTIHIVPSRGEIWAMGHQEGYYTVQHWVQSNSGPHTVAMKPQDHEGVKTFKFISLRLYFDIWSTLDVKPPEWFQQPW